jgi:hypothetical protein
VAGDLSVASARDRRRIYLDTVGSIGLRRDVVDGD